MTALPFRVKAVYDYQSPHDEDLSFPNGQMITVTDEEDADWYYGEYDVNGLKHQGLFPRNFVERYEPATPPRPTRATRPKKESEPAAVAQSIPGPSIDEDSGPGSSQPPLGPPMENSTRNIAEKELTTIEPKQQLKQPLPLPDLSSNSESTKPINKPPLPTASKPANPPISESSSATSFRDRIAAFNKPAAPPVAPTKPGALGGSLFIKKPYVAPPPSRNAYVPPPRETPAPKIYRREEDPEVAAQSAHEPEVVNQAISPPPAAPTAALAAEADKDATEDQPKPTSLKDRIALLQKQQLEQAARHTEAAQKKEKPKRPPKKRMESHHNTKEEGEEEGEDAEKLYVGDTTRGLQEESNDDARPRARSSTRQTRSKEATPLASPTLASKDSMSDPNDADQSGAGDTEDGGYLSTDRNDSDEKPRTIMPILPRRSTHESRRQETAPDEEDETEEIDEDEEEEDDVDPEVKRRMEIRERIAKMSGGMGMAGMFGPPMGMSPMGGKKQTSGSSTKDKGPELTQGSMDSTLSRGPPGMALPGMQRVRSPDETEKQVEVSKEPEPTAMSITQGHRPDMVQDVEDLEEMPVPKPRKSEDRNRTLAAPPPPSRGAAPPVPTERPMPPRPPFESRPVPLPPSSIQQPVGTQDDDEDEISAQTNRLSLQTNVSLEGRPVSRDAPLVPSARSGDLPPRPQGPRSPPQRYDERILDSVTEQTPASPINSNTAVNRLSRMPPIPGSSPTVASQSQNRAPPPPLVPSQAPPRRVQTGDGKNYLAATGSGAQDSDEEVTEYDGDYDTDIAPGATHKNALKSHARDASFDEPLTIDEDEYHHQGLPSLGPPPGPPLVPAAPRAIPPPPPTQPPKHARKSSDMPRTAPPPPPPPKEQLQEEDDDDDEYGDEYDPYSYKSPRIETSGSSGFQKNQAAPLRPDEDDNDLYGASPPAPSHLPPPSPNMQKPYNSSPIIPTPMPRQSLDVQRNASTRRSMDAPRPSGEQGLGFIATDVDLGRSSQWWLQRRMPPPVFQNRHDISFEIDESTAVQQGGGQSVVKTVFVVYMDYSQSVITARFDPKDPSKAELQQRHEPPPPRLRQDQLEDAHKKFSARIGEMANSKLNTTVGDGSQFSLITELLSSLPAALPPVGTRAYGALVYANLANATVQQHDEIRTGDLISFRNAKLQGHRGPMKQKYNVEVGKPDHVAVVVDWDGTKKKVRAWEQGRESKKVKIESFKLGDLKSGEVKVWRVMAREWVGWGGGQS